MNSTRSMTALVAVMSCFAISCEKGSSSGAQQGAPSQAAVDRGLASGGANAGGPFDINVTGAKTGTVSGRDASFCVTTGEITTGREPAEWGYNDATSGTLSITRSDDSKVEGTYELTAAPKSGGELRAKGKFEANPVKC